MNKITEIIPDDMPEWAKEAMAGGQLWNRVFGRIEELQARVKFLEDQCVEYKSQLRDIRNAALPDPYDERDISVEWLRAVINRCTPPEI